VSFTPEYLGLGVELSGAQSANSSVCAQFVPASWIILFVDFWMSLEEQFPNFWASCEQVRDAPQALIFPFQPRQVG
jgi:hypothetical protein